MFGGKWARAIAATVLSGLAATAFAAQPPAPFDYAVLYRFVDPGPTIVSAPVVLARPSSDDAGRAYPKRAQREQVNGRAFLKCRVSEAGRLADCKVTWEGPADYGFGAAALSLAARFAMRPQLVDGVARDDGVVNIPFNFSAFPGSAPAPLPPPEPPAPPRYAVFGEGVPAPPELMGLQMPRGELAALGSTPSGTMWFVSLDDQDRNGASIELSIMQAFPVPRFPFGPFNVWRYRVDCAANQSRFLGLRSFDEERRPDGWNLAAVDEAFRPLGASTPIGRAAAIACGRAPSGQVVASAEQAMAVTRRLPTP